MSADRVVDPAPDPGRGPDTAGEPADAAGGAKASPSRRRRKRQRVVRPGVGDEPVIPGRSADDTDVGWHEGADDSNDERLRRDVPPHW